VGLSRTGLDIGRTSAMISEWVQSVRDVEMVGRHWRWIGFDIHCELRGLQVSPKDITTVGLSIPLDGSSAGLNSLDT
jgi:hypothetical protein